MNAALIPATQNEAWGFWGTMADRAAGAWPIALSAVSAATGQPFEAARTFLDSVHGRHFADDVRNALLRDDNLRTAIAAAVERWMDWRIDRATSHRHGIPKGLPYLTGFVIHCGILEGEV